MASYKYKAFISYSHADERHGGWLQRALENFRAPTALVGQSTDFGPVPRRLTPIFRDRNDLPAGHDLSRNIQDALAESAFQIVICSPNAAKSRWVNEEVKLFKKLHGADRTLAVIVDGEPNAAAAGRPEEECFPPALRFKIDDAGELTGEPAEPGAADARRDRDGKRFALLKLAAGLLSVDLDDLVRRDHHRRQRRTFALAGASFMFAAVTSSVAAYALQQRAQAERMRGEAEDIVSFMLTTLRDKIEPTGRSDALAALAEKALSYYENLDNRFLDDGAKAARARALGLLGQINLRWNELATARTVFEDALQASEALLKRRPDDQRLIFDHAQWVFYLGEIAAKQNDLVAAETAMREYLRLAERLVALDPENPDWRLELAYATSNLGTMKLKAGEYAASIPYYEQSAAARRALMARAPENEKLSGAYAHTLSSIAHAQLKLGACDEAAKTLGDQIAIYQPILKSDAENFRVLDQLVTAERRLAEAHLCRGRVDAGRIALERAERTARRLIARDRSNAGWAINSVYIEREFSLLEGLARNVPDERAAAARALDLARRFAGADAAGDEAEIALAFALARKIDAGGDPVLVRDAAKELSRMMPVLLAMETESPDTAVAVGALALSRLARKAGDDAGAAKVQDAALERLDRRRPVLSARARAYYAELLTEAGRVGEARETARALSARGYADPPFTAFVQRLSEIAAR